MRRAIRILTLVASLLFIHTCILRFRRFLEGSQYPIDDPAESTLATEEAEVDEIPKNPVNGSLCQYNECLKGRWVPREPQFNTLADFQDVFARRGGTKWRKCNPPSPPPGVTRSPEETKQLEEQRMVDIMNWVWKPGRGEQIRWDAEDLVVRLLKTTGGMVFMGDSLTQGHDHSFGSLLEEAGIFFDTNPIHLPLDKGIRTHILKPSSPMTLALQKRAGVPESRLQYPIFSIIEEHLLVHEDDLRYLTGMYGAKDGWPWHLKTMKRAEDWENFFRWMTETRTGEEDTVTRDTILVMNTGAHWSRGTLYMLPDLDSLLQEQITLTRLYKTMVKTIIQKFSQFPHLTIFYRATNPGHPMCHEYTRPLINAAAAHELESRFLENSDASASNEHDKVVRRRWDWDLFGINNHVWRKEIQFLGYERTALQKRNPGVLAGPKWLFVDIYEMALQRPDAHASPGHDCLHWCLPSMYSEWSQHLYHLIYLEMEQG